MVELCLHSATLLHDNSTLEKDYIYVQFKYPKHKLLSKQMKNSENIYIYVAQKLGTVKTFRMFL
jgi:hypothetical protein